MHLEGDSGRRGEWQVASESLGTVAESTAVLGLSGRRAIWGLEWLCQPWFLLVSCCSGFLFPSQGWGDGRYRASWNVAGRARGGEKCGLGPQQVQNPSWPAFMLSTQS